MQWRPGGRRRAGALMENYPRTFLQVEKFGRLGAGIEKFQSLDENVARGLSCCDRMDEIFFTC